MLSIIHYQVVIVPIWKKDDEKTGVLNAASSVAEILKIAGLKLNLMTQIRGHQGGSSISGR